MYVCAAFLNTMILVTGASGLLGSHLVQALLQQQQPVKALYRSFIPQFENWEKADWIQGDILDIPFLEDAMQTVTQVYHCAALVSFHPSQTENLYKTNVEGTANVVNACLIAGVQKLLFVSSVAALGRTKNVKETDETMQWTASHSGSTYSKTKYLAEMEVWRGIGEGLPAVIVNPSIILGTGNWNFGSTQLFKNAYNEFPWYTDGVTGFVDVLDVVKAMMLLMNSGISSERFILNAENIAYKTLFDTIASDFQKKKPDKKVTPFFASLIWRTEAVRSYFTGKHPLLTKETAASAQTKVYYNNQKLLRAFPQFQYAAWQKTIVRICHQLKNMLNKR